MPFSALFALVALLSVTAIFIISLRKRGLKVAVFLSAIGLVTFAAIFFMLLTLALNNM
jgi:hypothetical protein